MLVSHDWHLVELVADRLWLVEGGTVRPFDDDLEAYRRRLLRARRPPPGAATNAATARQVPRDPRRAARRDAAERRVALEPLRSKSRQAEHTAARLAAEQRALDTKLAAPGAFGGDGEALAEALKRRAEMARLIAEAEAEWVAAESEIERMTQADRRPNDCGRAPAASKSAPRTRRGQRPQPPSPGAV